MNLLTIIRGHSDLLLDRIGAAESSRNSIEQIQKAAGRAVSMTRQLLAFSAGCKCCSCACVLDLNAVVADMGKMLPRLIGEHIEYTFQPAPRLSHVKADPGQIEQVILNLVVNSRDAMPNGGKNHGPDARCGYRRISGGQPAADDAGAIRSFVRSRYGARHGRGENENSYI